MSVSLSAAVSDELLVLAAVYGEAAVSWRSPVLRLVLLCGVSLRFTLPSGYPLTEPPSVEAQPPPGQPLCDAAAAALAACVAAWRPGDSLLFDAASAFTSAASEASAAPPTSTEVDAAAAAANAEAHAAARCRLAPLIVHGEPLCQQRSTFTAHACPVACDGDVAAFVELLLEDKKTGASRATHNILAFRFERGGILCADCDDDGEDGAGRQLLHVLSVTGCCGVAVVVSRVFGGIHLGPDRFKLISNAARQLLSAHGWIASTGTHPKH